VIAAIATGGKSGRWAVVGGWWSGGRALLPTRPKHLPCLSICKFGLPRARGSGFLNFCSPFPWKSPRGYGNQLSVRGSNICNFSG